MKRIEKWLLCIITAIVPVVIAACYGPAYREMGSVTDAETGEGIGDIAINCIHYDDELTEEDEFLVEKTQTNANGYYEFAYGATSEWCDELEFVDTAHRIDGNYSDKTIVVRDVDGFNGKVILEKEDA